MRLRAENATQQRLMETRSRALATVLLTRREGTVVSDREGTSDGSGIDLYVTLAPGQKPGLRQIGVGLKWQFKPVTTEQANGHLRDHGRWHQLTAAGPFPVVVFFFTMRDDGAWYAWVAEPVVDGEGQAQLPLRTSPDCRPLTVDALEELFDRVDDWYDAHYSGLTAALSGGARLKKS